MPRQRKDETLTLSQIAKIRATHSQRASQLMARLGKFANGDESVKMTPTQVRAATVVISNILPAQASTTFEDLTEDHGTAEEAQASMHEYLKTVLHSMSTDEIEALLGNDS